MNIYSPLISELKSKSYRDAYVVSQIRTGFPFQIRALRTSRKLSQEELAQRADMAQPRISELERITGRMPNLDTLCRIAAACDVALEVRFVPFSDLITHSENFDPESFRVPTFMEEIEEAASTADSAALQSAVAEIRATYIPNHADPYGTFTSAIAAVKTVKSYWSISPTLAAEKTAAPRKRADKTYQPDFDNFGFTKTVATGSQKAA